MDVARLEKRLWEARKHVDTATKRLHRGGADLAEAFLAAAEQAAAERALAAARGEPHAIPFELGVRWSGGAPLPHLLSSGRRSFVAFYLEPDPDWDGTSVRVVDSTSEEPAALALAEFKGCSAVKLGPPDDEVWHGHALDERGLEGYGTYVVEKSPWLAELIEMNRAHEQFNAQSWATKKHFLLLFHDETVEAIARDIDVQTFRISMPALLAQTIAKL